jgi:nitrosocyanin
MNNTIIAVVIIAALALIGGGIYFTGQPALAPLPITDTRTSPPSSPGANVPVPPASPPGSQPSPAQPTPPPPQIFACPKDAKICPDGSVVGRTEPNCEFAACPTSQAIKDFTVDGKNFSFSPSTLTVKRGDRVKITFKNTEGTHDFRIDEFNAKTQVIKSGTLETIEFTADKTGSFEYYCSVGSHRAMGMKGTLIVQ